MSSDIPFTLIGHGSYLTHAYLASRGPGKLQVYEGKHTVLSAVMAAACQCITAECRAEVVCAEPRLAGASECAHSTAEWSLTPQSMAWHGMNEW